MNHWLRSYGLLLNWDVLRLRSELPVFLTIQTLMSAGVVIGFSFLVPELDSVTALYLATGGMTVALITVGMVVAPQLVAQQRLGGVFDYQRSMPVPRLAMMAADATVWIGIGLPGMIAALCVAAVRFDLTLSVSPLIIPAGLLVATGSVAIGYGIAYSVKPVLVGLITNGVIIISLMFAPVNYPAQRLPQWLAAIHEWLPFQYMAQAIRESLVTPPAGISPLPFAVLAAWCVGGLTITSRVLTRRA